MSGLVTGLPRWLSGKRICLPVQGMQVGFLGQEDLLEEEMATHSSIAWKITWMEEPCGLQSMEPQTVKCYEAHRQPVPASCFTKSYGDCWFFAVSCLQKGGSGRIFQPLLFSNITGVWFKIVKLLQILSVSSGGHSALEFGVCHIFWGSNVDIVQLCMIIHFWMTYRNVTDCETKELQNNVVPNPLLSANLLTLLRQ